MTDAVKRLVDIAAAIVLLVVLGLPILLIAVAIRIDSSGPALFRQQRLGRDGRPFAIWKFRTMVVGAQQQGPGIFTHAGDERITRIGRWLRATSLDELPQLVNVLRGQMSLVGPRPQLPAWPHPYDSYPDRYLSRFSVRPGITGWSQVVSRNEAEWPQRLEEDLWYVTNHSLWLDLCICLRTVVQVVAPRGLYRPKPPAAGAQPDESSEGAAE